jgi:hypothetical protein
MEYSKLKSNKKNKRTVARSGSGVRRDFYPTSPSKVLVANGGILSNSTGAISLLNGIAPGFTIDGRLGRVVTLKQIKLDVQALVTPVTGVDQYNRFLVVYDHQPNGAALTILQVLNSVNVISARNFDNSARFEVLCDELHHLNASAEPDSNISFKVKIRRPLQTVFNSGTAGTIADIATGSLYVISIGSEVAGGTAGSVYFTATMPFISKV